MAWTGATPGHTKAHSQPDGKDTGQPKWVAPSCQLPGSSGWKQLKVWSFPGDSSFPGSGRETWAAWSLGHTGQLCKGFEVPQPHSKSSPPPLAS